MSDLSSDSYGKNIAWCEVNMLTEAQRKWISRVNDVGQIRYVGKGLGRAAWSRCMRDLAAIGLVQEHGHDFELTTVGVEYKRGADAAVRVWLSLYPHLRHRRWADDLVKPLSNMLGPNVPHPEWVVQGARERWSDILAGRFHVLSVGGRWWSES